jgi:hypothetical protein
VHSTPNIGRVTKAYNINVARGTYWGEVKCVQVLVGRPEVKRQLVRTRRGWDIDTKISVQGIGWEGVHRIHLAPDK